MFETILVANRGEIACRIIKTARSMGIRTIAIYSSVDKNSLHVQQADNAYCVGEAPAKDSYLNIANIIKAAKDSGAQAIHPGYGFLSENAEFAAACDKEGIVFIGPTIAAMQAMASKQLSKQLLEKTNVPLTPGYHGAAQDSDTLLAEAKKIGFPVLLKAAHGGGGKGMRSVLSEAEFQDALAGAQREALSSFGNNTMIIEKLVLNPRHVEVQILADNHGNVIHLFERDCSIQRRHQKIIEEAPAPNLSETLRNKLAEAACEVALSINYTNAGTIEFLVDQDEHFYFMEMNTRLQVEHPVTEMITGLDLVALQFKIAANEPLPITQKDIKVLGHAIECRIYAEDPYNNFVPSIGQLHFLVEPQGIGIRLDSGVALNSEITRFYDPMIAKLIAWGSNREEALQRLQRALPHYLIGGVKTNIPFLQAICKDERFRKAQLTTAFLSEEPLHIPLPDKELALLMAIGYDYLSTLQNLKDPLCQNAFAWRTKGKGNWTWRYQLEDEMIEAHIYAQSAQEFNLKLKDKTLTISPRQTLHQLTLETRDQQYHARVEQEAGALVVYTNTGPCRIARFVWPVAGAAQANTQGTLTAPMPGTLVAILKNAGDKVQKGDALLVLEAMKMEHTIHAPRDGILEEIFYALGAQVDEGAQLLSLNTSADA